MLTRNPAGKTLRNLASDTRFMADPEGRSEAFAVLRAGPLAPRRWWPRIKAPDVFRFARTLLPGQPDPRCAMAAMPPLLRSYLARGGWVGDHAAVDPVLRTMHVFTGSRSGRSPAAGCCKPRHLDRFRNCRFLGQCARAMGIRRDVARVASSLSKAVN